MGRVGREAPAEEVEGEGIRAGGHELGAGLDVLFVVMEFVL